MKNIWEAQDIECGRIVHRIPPETNLNTMEIGSKADRLSIISSKYNSGDGPERTYFLVSLADGLISGEHGSKDAFADFLSEGSYLPTSGADKDIIIEAAAKVVVRQR